MRSILNGTGRRSVGLLILAALGLSGCANVVDGTGNNSGRPSGQTSADFPSGATSAAPSTSSEPPTTGATPTPTGSTGNDITDVKYRVPSGWQRSANYVEVIPLEVSFQTKYLVPAGSKNSLDVISIVLYRLPGPHLVDTHAQQVARVHGYEQKRELTIVRPLKSTAIGGVPAFSESVVQPGVGSSGDFRYATWYIFGGAHLVQISCQVASQVDTVAAGCQKLLDSVTFA